MLFGLYAHLGNGLCSRHTYVHYFVCVPALSLLGGDDARPNAGET